MTSEAILQESTNPTIAKRNPNSKVVKATLLLTSTLSVMAPTTIAPSLPAMQAHFANVTNSALLVRMTLTVPALFIVLGAPLAGLIVDRFGRKSLLVISTALYGLAGGAGFFMPSLFGILVTRAILGLGVAGIMTSVTTLIADYYVGPTRARLLGLQAAFMGLGGTVFVTLGGFLADIDWRNPFLIYLASFAVLPLIIFALFEPTLGIQPGIEKAAFNDDEPPQPAKLPVKLLVLIYGTQVLLQVIFYLVPVQLPFYLQALSGASATQSGLAISAIATAYATGSLLSARISSRLERLSLAALTFGFVGVSFTTIGLAGSYAVVLIGLAIGGLGFGFLIPTLGVWLATEVPESLRGRALGGLTTFTFLGQFLSPILTQPIIQRVDLGMTYASAGGLMLTLTVLVLIHIRSTRNRGLAV